MDINLAKCFICDMDCDSKCTNQGLYIAQTLTMPLISVLTKCLRTFVEVENEYFCCECVRKIVEYDNLAKLSLEIETDLYRQYQNKPFRSNFLDDEFIVDQNEIRDKISDFFDFKPNLKFKNVTAKTTTVVDEIDLTIGPNDIDDDEPEEEEEELNEAVDIGDIQNIEAMPVVFEQIEQIDQSEPNERDNEDEDEVCSENSELKSKDDDDDADSWDAAVENIQSANEQQTNSAKKRKIKKVRKRRRRNINNNNTLSGDPARVSCDICGRTYQSKGALGTHMVKHSDQNPHGNIRQTLNLTLEFMILLNFFQTECVICKKVFTQRLGLLRHIPIHSGEQQYQVESTANN